jgi:uncharacterized protein YjiK
MLKRNLIIISLFFVFIASIVQSCSDSEEVIPVDDQLELIAKFKIDVPEPSGLAIDRTGTTLYTVSDNTNQVYKISTEGEVIKTYNYSGNDLEGVSVYKDNKLLLAEERLKMIVVYDMSGGPVKRYPISYDNNEDNSGIEGVAYNTHDGSIFILNEKNPGLLMRLRSDFTVLKAYDLGFASDYSGIFYDSGKNDLWIVSDQNKTINHCTISGGLIKSYSVNIDKVEGIVLTNNKIYVVSDADAYMYIYKRP